MLYQLSYRAKLREQDLNLRPSGYEPDELPTAPPRDNIKEDKGFEPLHAFTRLTVFKTVPFSRTWVILHDKNKTINNVTMDLVGLEPTTARL